MCLLRPELLDSGASIRGQVSPLPAHRLLRFALESDVGAVAVGDRELVVRGVPGAQGNRPDVEWRSSVRTVGSDLDDSLKALPPPEVKVTPGKAGGLFLGAPRRGCS